MTTFEKYEEEMVRLISTLKPQMLRRDIRDAIHYSINKRYKPESCVLDNNYTKTQLNTTLLEMTDWINEKEPICTAYGVLFKKHGSKMHPLIALIRSVLAARDIDKGKMFEALKVHDYENAAKFDLFQLLDKRDANSFYGCMGSAACVLYNLYVAGSITAQGRSIISTATMFFESFLANSVKFGSLEEVLHFIDNVRSEKPYRKYNDREILDRDVTIVECFTRLILTCGDWRKGKFKWVPDLKDAKIIYDIVSHLDQQDLNRIYYKNNLYAFLDNTVIMNAIVYILKALKEPFLTPNNVPEEIKVELDILQDFFREYVYYPHMIIDRIDRCNNMVKNVCVISDTDSTIVCFDPFYKYILNRVMGEDIPIMDMEVDLLNDKIETVPHKEKRYDFFNDEVIERDSLIKPFYIIPQNNLRFSIINIIAYISGDLCNEYVELYTKHNHSWAPDRKCLLYLKNEFLFSRTLLTNKKKNYATNQESKEGVVLEQNIKRSLDIKGLPINKSTLNDKAKAELQKILYEDILTSKHIDQLRIIEKIAILEKDIEQSLRSGSKEYYKPASIKAYESYDDPMRIQGIKASIMWNRLKDPDLEAIDLTARNTVGIVKVNISPTNIDKIKDRYPDVYERLIELFTDPTIFGQSETKKKDITALAIPVNIDTPEWVKEFIDYRAIANDNITNFPFECVGITRLGSSDINYSTILKI